jgi:nitrous oxidase accessory protein
MNGSVQQEMNSFLETPLWLQIWEQKTAHIIAFSLFLIMIIVLMILMDRYAKRRRLAKIIQLMILSISFIYVGLILKAQPTTTNIIIMLNSLKELQFPLGLYLLEPYIFLSFIFIFLTLIIWGRGVFCGWLCPYGAMVELLNKIYNKLLKRRLVIPARFHWKLLYLKYGVFFLIVAVSFYNFILSEYLTEIEPFRTFVLKLHREWYFVLYFIIITLGSVAIYRGFCRYLCPLGAALALPSLLRRMHLVKLNRYDFCGTCKTCGKTCSYQAITTEGFINSRECFYCMDCQINFWDEDICPVLIKQKREKEREDMGHSISTLAILLLATFLFIPSLTHARTIVVGVDSSTIGDAVKVAGSGDTIEVRGGEYREKIRIDKSIHLKGIDGPIIKTARGNLIEITAPGVIVEGLTLTYESPDNLSLTSQDTAIYVRKGADGVVIKENRFLNVLFGIWNFEGKDLSLINNTIVGIKSFETEHRGNCINLTGSQKVRVTGNKLSYCRDGIYMELCHDATVIDNEIEQSRYSIHTMWVDRGVFNRNTVHDNLVGLAIMYTDYPAIRNNLAYGNRTHGLLLIQAVRGKIIDNTVIGNTKGIFLYNSVYNTITSNLVINNQVGIHSWGGSEDNTIKENSFINNEIQVKFVAGKSQFWENNYWSDYIGWDMTGDSIGDFPYESNTVVDHIFWRYPVAKVLFASPALHLLWMIEKQFPLLKVPRVVDRSPAMLPLHSEWKEVKERYSSYEPERIYGRIEKLPHLPGGGF